MSDGARARIEIIDCIETIPAKDWNKCAGDNPFLQHNFFSALEGSGCAVTATGWQPIHLVARDNETLALLGVMPLYVKRHSYGEYVFDHAWANAYTQAGGSYYPKLQSAVPFTPVTGKRLLLAPNTPQQIATQMLRAASHLTEQQGLSSLHITFLTKEEAHFSEQEGYLTRKDQQFHWCNANYGCFEDFLTALSSRKRKQIKKERKASTQNNIQVEVIEGKDISPDQWDAFYSFYKDTSSRKWGHAYLNRDFFAYIGNAMPQHIVMILCKRDSNYIAGALNFKNTHTLYGRYWGCIEDHPYLHFEVCYYQAIEYAITHKLQTVEAGAQGEHKLARGYIPTETYSAHWISDPGFRSAVAQFLEAEKHNIEAEIDYLKGHAPFKKL